MARSYGVQVAYAVKKTSTSASIFLTVFSINVRALTIFENVEQSARCAVFLPTVWKLSTRLKVSV